MPLTTTHALVVFAGPVAFPSKPMPWTLLIVASIAAAAPDLDAISKPVWGFPPASPCAHRGLTHSLFVALAFGLLAALFHKRLAVQPLVAAVVIAGAMASHGLLDMMTDSGQPVAYLWPVSSIRIFADWRPIHSGPVALSRFVAEALARQRSEAWQVLIPLFAIAYSLRGIRALVKITLQRSRPREDHGAGGEPQFP